MNTRGFPAILLVVLFVVVAGLSSSAAMAKAPPIARPPVASMPLPAGYVELLSYWRSDQQYDAWFDLLDRARHDFDDICGDTFCEGDYSNIQSLRLVCSARASDGVLGQCVWNFAASNESVDPDSGRISTEFAHWACPSPLAPGTTAEQLVQSLNVAHPLYQALPGTDRTLYDGLAECL